MASARFPSALIILAVFSHFGLAAAQSSEAATPSIDAIGKVVEILRAEPSERRESRLRAAMIAALGDELHWIPPRAASYLWDRRTPSPRAGLQATVREGGVFCHVLPRGSAEAAGILSGDQLISINGIAVSPAAVPFLDGLHSRDGGPIEVVVAGGSGEIRSVVLTQDDRESGVVCRTAGGWTTIVTPTIDARTAAAVADLVTSLALQPVMLDLRGAVAGDVEGLVAFLSLLAEPGTRFGTLRTAAGLDVPLAALRGAPAWRPSRFVVAIDRFTAGVPRFAAAAAKEFLGAHLVGETPPTGFRLSRFHPLNDGAAIIGPGADLLRATPETQVLTVDTSVVGDATTDQLIAAVTNGTGIVLRPGDAVWAVESAEWFRHSGGEVFFYRGTVEIADGDVVKVTLLERFKLLLRPKAPEGVLDTGWWPENPKRYSYGSIEFKAWRGKHTAGEGVVFPRDRIRPASTPVKELADDVLAIPRQAVEGEKAP